MQIPHGFQNMKASVMKSCKVILAALVIAFLLIYQAIPSKNAFRPIGMLLNHNFLRATNVTNSTVAWTDIPDAIFAPILEAYRNRSSNSTGSTPVFRNGEIPKILLFARPFYSVFWGAQLSHIRHDLCPLPCSYTFDIKEVKSVDAVVIYLRGLDKHNTLRELYPRDHRQPWIVLSFEAPIRANSFYRADYSPFNGVFNRSMFYRSDSDVVVPHGFVVKRGRDSDILPKQWHAPPITAVPNNKRKIAVALISNCGAPNGRLQYVKEVQKYIPVDIYGKCGPLKCGRSLYVQDSYNSTQNKCLILAGMKYLFYFAFENAHCSDYVTEKLYNVLYYPVVPVVFGGANYSSLLPPNSYINARKFTPVELASFLHHLSKSPKEYQKYHEWRQHYHVSLWGGQRSLCHLCVRLHDPAFYQTNTIQDFQYWFVNQSRCGQI